MATVDDEMTSFFCQKFDTLCLIIESLLSLKPIPSEMVLQKLAELESVVQNKVKPEELFQVDDSRFVELATEWKRKIAQYREHVSLSSGKDDVNVSLNLVPISLKPPRRAQRRHSLESVLELFCPLKN